jgi:hypothetical protein
MGKEYTRAMRVPLLAAALLGASLYSYWRLPQEAEAPGYQLFEKGDLQVLRDPLGRSMRLIQDVDDDGRAETAVVFDARGHPAHAELDINRDGTVETREYYDLAGAVRRRERDTNGDGRVDVVTFLAEGAMVREERDADGDGRFETVRRP